MENKSSSHQLYKRLKELNDKLEKLQNNLNRSEFLHNPEHKKIISGLSETFEKLYYQSKNDNFFWQYCPLEVYEYHFERRIAQYNKNYTDASILDFIRLELRIVGGKMRDDRSKSKFITEVNNTEEYPYYELNLFDFRSSYKGEILNAKTLENIKFSTIKKLEFLSRQHIDFKTVEGMKQLLQAVTWRAKVEESLVKVIIYVRKKRIPDVRRLAKEFGIDGVKYEVKEIRWFECWFKRFQVVEKKEIS